MHGAVSLDYDLSTAGICIGVDRNRGLRGGECLLFSGAGATDDWPCGAFGRDGVWGPVLGCQGEAESQKGGEVLKSGRLALFECIMIGAALI